MLQLTVWYKMLLPRPEVSYTILTSYKNNITSYNHHVMTGNSVYVVLLCGLLIAVGSRILQNVSRLIIVDIVLSCVYPHIKCVDFRAMTLGLYL